MSEVHGAVAEFSSEKAFMEGLRNLRLKGFDQIDAYMPYFVEGAAALIPHRKSPIPWIMGIAGALGGSGAYFLQWYATHDFPTNVGGRPLTSWPSFVPVTFELTVLTAALTGLAAFLIIARFPLLYHPIFEDARFLRASSDRFFICVRAQDPKYTFAGIQETLGPAKPDSIEELVV